MPTEKKCQYCETMFDPESGNGKVLRVQEKQLFATDGDRKVQVASRASFVACQEHLDQMAKDVEQWKKSAKEKLARSTGAS